MNGSIGAASDRADIDSVFLQGGTMNELPLQVDQDNGEELSQDEARQAERIETTVFNGRDGAQRTGGLIVSFLASCPRNPDAAAQAEWLYRQFSAYPALWSGEDERRACASEVVTAVHAANAAKVELYAHFGRGKSRESWLAEKLEQGAAAAGVANVGNYASGIDRVLETATRDMADTVYNKQSVGGAYLLSQNPSLDGFIAEQHHVDTFNVEAATRSSALRARAMAPEAGATYQKNSMDIGIYDADGKLLRRYQAKYCKDADATTKAFKAGDYRGQRKLVCAEQADQIDGATDVIEADGIRSKPLSKEQAKRLQERAQQEGEIRQYDWNDVNRIKIAKELGSKAVMAAAIGAGLQGARILARRAWNVLLGKQNQPLNDDLMAFFASALNSGKEAGTQVAVAGALVVAARSGWINVLRFTPAAQIANIAYVGMENAKVLYKFSQGELSVAEAADAMGNITCSAIGGILGTLKGAAAGAAIGALAGPVGAAVGGFVGGMVGCVAGSTVGQAVYNAGKTLSKATTSLLNEVGSGLASASRALFSLFS
jgi:hypothetical protein